MHCQNIVDGICVQKEFFKNLKIYLQRDPPSLLGFCLGGFGNFVGSGSGQIQSVT